MSEKMEKIECSRCRKPSFVINEGICSECRYDLIVAGKEKEKIKAKRKTNSFGSRMTSILNGYAKIRAKG